MGRPQPRRPYVSRCWHTTGLIGLIFLVCFAGVIVQQSWPIEMHWQRAVTRD